MNSGLLSAGAALCLVSIPSTAPASTPSPAGPATNAPTSQVAPAPPRECCILAAGTVVEIELAQPVGTRWQKRGDLFALKLAEPLIVDGQPVVPAGASGYGEVVDAAGGGMAGRPAKLILAARFIDYGGVRVLLHGFKLSGGGHDNSGVAVALSATPYVGVLAIAIPGGEVKYPAGTRARAKVTADAIFPPAPPSQTPPASR
jgi:hypothetical protein